MSDSVIRSILTDLTYASRISQLGGVSKGRLKRSPNYTNPSISSSRPVSDIGVTFHFAHKSISKRNDVSSSARDATSAASHQAYIERLEAVGDTALPLNELIKNNDDNSQVPTAMSANFNYPEVTAEPGKESFGTLGNNKADRADFWRKVEVSEGRTARVQNRIIAELPYEVTQEERIKIAVEFSRVFSQNGLPFWAAIHTPTKANDKRNYHLHIAYYDRPSAKSANGKWDFEVTEIKIKKNRTKVEVRPYKQNKLENTRVRQWVKSLREEYAFVNNNILAAGGYSKRLDHRSYRESGIRKQPTEHLGFKSNAAEKFGLETTIGRRNSLKEFKWKVSSATERWDNAIAYLDAKALFAATDADEPTQYTLAKKTMLSGRDHDLMSAKYALLAEAVTRRVHARRAFLTSESKRINSNEKQRTDPENQAAVMALTMEHHIIEERLPEIQKVNDILVLKAVQTKALADESWSKVHEEVAPHSFNNQTELDDNPSPPYPVKRHAKPQQPDIIFNAFEDTISETPIDQLFGDEAEDRIKKIVENADRMASSERRDAQTEPLQTATEKAYEDQSAQTVPGALLVPEDLKRSDLLELNKILMAMPNVEVRVRAIASRDAARYLDPGVERTQANRGWMVLKLEAEKRGIDLLTGQQDLAKATDIQRSKLHSDQPNQSILEIRREIIRVMSR